MLESGRDFFYEFRFVWNKVRDRVRTHLSNLITIILCTIVITFQRHELTRVIYERSSTRLEDILLLVFTLLALMSAIWEIWRNRIIKSDRFAVTMRLLLIELERFAYGLDREPNIEKRLNKFLDVFLELAIRGLPGGKNTAADIMLQSPESNSLTLVKASREASYPEYLRVPLPAQDESTGLAGLAFIRQQIMYMPSKRRGVSFPIERAKWEYKEGYQQLAPIQGWIPAPVHDKENFRSVLCFPLSIYEAQGRKRSFGVLSFSSTALNSFNEQDFIIGECFSSILAQAIHLARSEAKGEIYAEDSSSDEQKTSSEKLSHLKALPRLETDQKTLHLRAVRLENIRCFKNLTISFEDDNVPYLTTVILGDNAAGKSTILRSIALGLCPESDAVSLIKKLPGRILHKGASYGSIAVYLRSADGTFEGSILTMIEATSSGGQEVIHQLTEPANFPWDQVFVCGYGTQRDSGRPSSYEGYETRLAVASLFSDSSDLLNPEVVLLRRHPEISSRLDWILKQVLLLDGPGSGIRRLETGIELAGPWGSQPLSAVSDGYRSTSKWVLDYLGWQILANRMQDSVMDGMLLVDELEQHLHPCWQRYFLQRLRAQFNQTQIIVSTHTPLIAAAVADLERSQVVRLVAAEDGSVEAQTILKEHLTGKRADQVLGDAFGLITSKSPGSIDKVDRYAELLSRSRNNAEEEELETLRRELNDSWSSEDSALTRAAEKVVSKVLDEMIDQGREVVDIRVKQRLLELFSTEEKE